jgi:hypothetical protein
VHYQKQNACSCSLSDCDRPHYGNDYCRPHWRRFKRYGDPLGWKHQQAETCEVKDCNTTPQAKNMCSAHYQRWLKYGDPLADRRRPRRFCVLTDCDSPVHGHGWCFKHYQRWRAHGDPEWQPKRFEACVVKNCEGVPRSALASMCEAHYMRLRRNGTLEAGQCSICQGPLPPRSPFGRLYCEACALRRRRDRAKNQEHSRRAALTGSGSERINSLEIYERDGWKCGLCHRKVNPKLTWPHRMSPSLDHIIPLAKGGHHVRTNVHLAHLTCNLSKQDRGGGEQLMLIG